MMARAHSSAIGAGLQGPGGPRFPDSAGRFGYATRHVRCDCCLRDYLPQHCRRRGHHWWWICGNCSRGGSGWFASTPDRVRFRKYDAPAGITVDPEPRRRYHFDRLRHVHEFSAARGPGVIPRRLQRRPSLRQLRRAMRWWWRWRLVLPSVQPTCWRGCDRRADVFWANAWWCRSHPIMVPASCAAGVSGPPQRPFVWVPTKAERQRQTAELFGGADPKGLLAAIGLAKGGG